MRSVGRGGAQNYWRLTESGVLSGRVVSRRVVSGRVVGGWVVGGGVVGELVFRHSPTCRLVSDHRGK